MGMPAEMVGAIASETVTVEIWPDTAEAFAIFERVQTQWRVGMAGPTGLDYGSLPAVLDIYEVKASRRAEIFDDIRVMEGEALKVMGERNGG